MQMCSNFLTVASGAGNSKGKSSWTSKAELQDYISFVGFFMYYLSGVYPPHSDIGPFDNFSGFTPVSSDLAPVRPPARLLLAGYSYGALLTRHLPNVPAILSQFSRVLKTSTQAEIRRRAYNLAFITARDLPSPAYLASIEYFKPSAKQMLEEKAKKHRNELKTPFVREKAKDSWPNQHLEGDPSEVDYTARVEVPTPMTHYLLISILFGPAALFVTGFRKLADVDMGKLDEKFQHNPTAIIHGDWDKITSESRLIDWVAKIEDRSGGKCQLVGVDGAGHSWKEKGAMNKLKSLLRQFFEGCLEQQSEEESPNLATITEQEERS
ncbi:MAG: hypothetical protein L6R38_008129 [Xanthoria sp. 2 TBL-2021]|nr:MAG: hypothetical protein L6R38_008129 [Xanthoria sp. 2 TBL-2021]